MTLIQLPLFSYRELPNPILVSRNRPVTLKELLEIFKIENQKKTPNERSIVEGGLPLMRFCNPSVKSERLFNIADGLQISHTTLYRLIKAYAEDAGCSQSSVGSSESTLECWVEMFTCL
jgi:hypothetical protein